MLVVRAWPSRPPAGRPHVVDGWPRVRVDDYDYSALAALGESVIVMDWDIAISPERLNVFAGLAAMTPDLPFAGAYRLYGAAEPVWAMRRFDSAGHLSYCEVSDASCHLFGFGLAYLPGERIEQFVSEHPGQRMDDTTWSGWHYRLTGYQVPIAWDSGAVHLHYDVPPGGRL